MPAAELLRCADCGFDVREWDRVDAGRLLRQADVWLATITERDPQLADLHAALPQADLHGVHHLMWRAGRLVWAGTPPRHGAVAALHVSDGGVPKTAVARALCSRRGLDGDRQADRENHGSPLQALCLWSAEVIEALQAEGHPIGFGSAGENLTVRGLEWARVAPGQRWNVGPLRIETTAWATPCRDNARWFAGGDFRRMSHPLHPGWSRIYARVVRTGAVSVGDPIVLEPDLAGWQS